jgi:hypothetical protein
LTKNVSFNLSGILCLAQAFDGSLHTIINNNPATTIDIDFAQLLNKADGNTIKICAPVLELSEQYATQAHLQSLASGIYGARGTSAATAKEYVHETTMLNEESLIVVCIQTRLWQRILDSVAPDSYDADFIANPYLVATACRAEATNVHNMYTPAAAKRLLRLDARWLARLRWAPNRHARTVALKTKHAERKKAQREANIARQQDTSLVPVIKRQIKAVNKEICKLVANLTDQQRQLKLNAKNQRLYNLSAKLDAAMDVDIAPIGDTSRPVDEEEEQEQEEAEYGVPTTDDENDDDDNDDDAKVNIKMIETHYSLY